MGGEMIHMFNDGRERERSDASSTVVPEGEESLTRQSEASQADINAIMKRFESAGVIPVSERPGVFADVSHIGNYQDALDRVRRADEYFMQLPAGIRAKYDNSVAKLLDVLNNPTEEQLQELADDGIVPFEEVPEAVPPVVPPVP